jgi:isocitrate/isopropylmalate dehydrogenase
MRIVVLPGDGIGPEITAATVRVLERASRRFSLDVAFEPHEIGLASLKTRGSTLPSEALQGLRHWGRTPMDLVIVRKALADPSQRTRDLGGTLGTKEFTETVCREIDGSRG